MYGNSYYARTLGWGSRIDDITRYLGLDFTPSSPDDASFVAAVRTWQGRAPGLEVDGILGPRSWSRMQADLATTVSLCGKSSRPPNRTTDPALNCHLTLAQGVIRTAPTDPVIAGLDEWFARACRAAFVTSIFRSPSHQLAVIVGMARKRLGVAPSFTSADVQTKEGATGNYVWQRTWSNLLRAGFVVNPPVPCPVLDSYRVGDRVRPAGTVVGSSPHSIGRAFDIGCGSHGASVVGRIVREAAQLILPLRSAQVIEEAKNNCVHVGLRA